MKIVFISLASHFTEGMNYQDNAYANQARIDGHDVTIVSDCEKFVNGQLTGVPEETTYLKNGAKLIRVKYQFILTHFISSKIRSVPSISKILEKEQPDLVYCHAMEYEAINPILKFIKKNKICLLADEHADFGNSAKTFLSKNVLYRLFYRRLVKKAIKVLPCVFCITTEVADFVQKLYKVPENMIKIMPLGGDLLSNEEYNSIRENKRNELGIRKEDILFSHSGKISKLKRTQEILAAFHSTNNSNYKLVIAGTIDPEIELEIEKMIQSDSRIIFLGWVSGNELNQILCASDVYIQIGSQSATLQDAICCRNAIIVYPHKTYTSLLGGAGFYTETEQELSLLISSLTINQINEKRHELEEIAKNQLDYAMQLSVIYSFCTNYKKEKLHSSFFR
jgi:hypothetical protein